MVIDGDKAPTINRTANNGAIICTYTPATSQLSPKNHLMAGGANKTSSMAIGTEIQAKNKLIFRKVLL